MALVAYDKDGASEFVDVDLKTTAEKTGVVLQLAHDGHITGTVVDSEKAPVPYAQVTFFVETQTVAPVAGAPPEIPGSPSISSHPRSQGVVVTDGNGRFTIGGLVAGDYVLSAQRPTATSMAPSYGSVSLNKVQLGQDVVLTLAGLGSISGRVVFEDGTPALGAGITIARWQPGKRLFPPPRSIDRADGHFRYEEVPAGRYGIKVTGDSVIDVELPDPVEVGAGQDLQVGTIKVSHGATRHGVVLTAEGAPAPESHVLIQAGARSFDEVADERGASASRPCRRRTR